MSLSLPSLPTALAAPYPVLLLPVGVQVKFVQPATGVRQLWVRIYPDQLSVSTHEELLTADEIQAGAAWHAATALRDEAHWRGLVARYGAPRAQWIVRQTAPAQPTPVAAPGRWTRAAEARGLPQRFMVLLYQRAATRPDVADGPTRDLLFPATSTVAYDPAAVPNPTTEFLTLYKAVEGLDLDLTHGLPVGPAPSANAVATDVGGVDAGNEWTVKFDQAVAAGMAVKINLDNLSAADLAAGFARLVVLGVRPAAAGTGAPLGQEALAGLLCDHAYTSGAYLLAQGTPTNNTDSAASGYSSAERGDAAATFKLLSQSTSFSDATAWGQRADGQHLARALGVADADMPPLAGARSQCDVHEAILFNQALWPATYGYFLEELLRPLLSDAALAWTRELFENYVLARGIAPALRVGAQPYGLLPTTRFSAWQLDTQAPDYLYAKQLQAVLGRLDAVWTERLNPQAGVYGAPAAPGAPAPPAGPAPDAGSLLGALGLDATSGEYYQRYLIGPLLAEALSAHAGTLADDDDGNPPVIWAGGSRPPGPYDPTADPAYQDLARLLDPTNEAHLRQTAGGQPAAAPPVFAYTFQRTFNKLAAAFADEPGPRRQEGALVDEAPLSETALVAALPQLRLNNVDVDLNYLQWLATASFDDIRREHFDSALGANFPPPNTLLYRLLRQAVLLAYWQAARQALSLPASFDEETFNVTATNQTPRWAWLYKKVGGQNQELYKGLRDSSPTLDGYLAAVGELGTLPTARLERLLAEHLDLGSYRLDAWRLAPVAQRLRQLRAQHPTGTHLGAFGWLENLRPEDHATFNPSLNAYEDPDNLGYLHAPSPAHAATAALLRHGYKSRQLSADAADPVAARMAVDVSSRRTRAAVELLEGLRGGSSLGVLLGQRFERAVHDQTATVSGRPFAYYLPVFRQAFPLAIGYGTLPGPGQSAPTGLAPDQAARQVVDGAALLRAVALVPAYPYGLVGLPAATSNFATFLGAELGRLTDELDALGDLGMGEGIYQATRGNVDRAAAVLDAVAKGQFPTAPDFVQPPRRGLTLTQRVLVQLPAALSGPASGWPTAAPTPRAAVAPRLNAWLSEFFAAPAALTFQVGWREPTGAWPRLTLALDQTDLHPLDLLYLADDQALLAGSALDRVLLYHFAADSRLQLAQHGSAAVLAIDYAGGTGPTHLRDRLPLLARLRQLLGAARPARSQDLQAPGRVASDNPDLGVTNDLGDRLDLRQDELYNLLDANATPVLGPPDFYRALLHGVPEALPGLAADADLAVATRGLRAALKARLAAATAALPTTGTATVAQRLAQASALLGSNFQPDVEFLQTDAAAQTEYAAALLPATTTSLLRHHAGQPLVLQEWLHGLGAVREPLNHLDKVLLIQSLLDPDAEPTAALRPAQLTTATTADTGGQAHYWLGLPWPTGPVTPPGSTTALPAYVPPGDALSLVQWLPAGYAATAVQCALLLDEWAEVLPLPTQTTAVAFHYDQPNAAAPQAMLLVVPPQVQPTGSWTAADLVGAVNDTLDLAKKRTVEPTALAATPLAPVLPAVVAPVAQQAVTLTLDLGRVNGTARFNEEVLDVPLSIP